MKQLLIKMSLRVFGVGLVLILAACVSTERNYVSAGFKSSAEARPYVDSYLYFANKLTSEEWSAFYARFPEYFKDIQTAKLLGATTEYHPWYVAYAFRWTTLQRRENWSRELLVRLEQGESLPGDDVFQLVYAKGPPARLIWDNDVEVLLYANDMAFVMNSSKVARTEPCAGCSKKGSGNSSSWLISNGKVLKSLGVERPKYSALYGLPSKSTN